MGTPRKVKDRQACYAGQYVALDPATSDRVIAHGPKSNIVAAQARRAGIKVPVIIYVPEKDAASLY